MADHTLILKNNNLTEEIKMAAFFTNLLDKFRGFDSDEEYEENEYDETEETAQEIQVPGESKTSLFRRQSRVVDFTKPASSSQQVVIIQPSCIESAQEVCNHLRAGRTVICNYEKIDQKVAQRVMDFITGSTFAIDGQVHKVSPMIFVAIPRNISLMDENNPIGMEYLKQQPMYASR